jgi:hypothetical protein
MTDYFVVFRCMLNFTLGLLSKDEIVFRLQGNENVEAYGTP